MKKSFTEEEVREAIRRLIVKNNDLNESPLDTQKISAAVSRLGSDPGVISDITTGSLKQYFLEMLLDHLTNAGFPVTKTSMIGRIMVQVIQRMSWFDIAKYFTSDEACGNLTEVILKGVQEAFQEKGYDSLIQLMFGVPGARLQGFIGSPIRELINRQFLEMTEMMRDPIIDFLCVHRDVERFSKALMTKIPGVAVAGEISQEFDLGIDPDLKIK
tara:strand:+ start:445 stop:1089 length:645 start_codon:yes stop_codon:yes gene_type:complete